MSNNIRQFIDLVEYGPKAGYAPDVDLKGAESYRDLDGRRMNDNITYHHPSASKVVAVLSSYNSQVYTKLGQKYERISQLETEIKQLKEEVKQESRDNVADLFSADDAVRTRVVETNQFIFEMTKDPKATETVKWAEVVKELETHLTPELIAKLETIKQKYKGVTQKAAAISVSRREETAESVLAEAGFMDKLKDYFHRFLGAIMQWGKRYDKQLDALKARAAAIE